MTPRPIVACLARLERPLVLASLAAVLSSAGIQGQVVDSGSESSLRVTCAADRPSVRVGGAVGVRAWAIGGPGRRLRHTWLTAAGELTGASRSDGSFSEAVWSLAGVEPPGPYTALLRVEDETGRFATCSAAVFVLAERRDGGRLSGRALLPREEVEESGYGLYSYLLFARPPADEERQRYLGAIAALLRFLPELEEMERLVPDRTLLNATYLPVRPRDAADSGDDSAWIEAILPPREELLSPEGLGEAAERVLAHYDFERSAVLLSRLEGTHPGGPYLLSTSTPLGGAGALSARYLYQDLSRVPPDLVPRWMEAFLAQVARPRYWEEDSVDRLRGKMRVAVAVLAEAVPDILESLQSWVRLLSARELAG